MSQKYNNQIYDLYEKEVAKNQKLSQKYEKLRWEVEDLRYENKKLKFQLDNMDSIIESAVNKAVEKATKPLIEEINNLKGELNKAYNEIDRLKNELVRKDNEVARLKNELIEKNNKANYEIDKLTNKINKNSSNSGIPTSKEMSFNKSRVNKYNHREKSNKHSGGQIGHKGSTLTKEKVEELIDNKMIEVKEITHYVKGNKLDKVKYKICLNLKPYIEKHIFLYDNNSNEKFSKSFYSDVTYNYDIKNLIVILGNYCCLSYKKISEFIYDISRGIINISEGTIDNIYEGFNELCKPTLENITNNILNGHINHTDEIVTSENGEDTYYRGYANPTNVIYKYHNHKGDKPIIEDGILPKYMGTIISDHDTCIFKYGKNNQDCIVHIGRYCKEAYQNIYETNWQMELYYFLLRQQQKREISKKFGQHYFEKEDIIKIETEYDKILEKAKIENETINSTYWKDKEKTFYNRLVKYKKSVLFYIFDFTVPYDNNFIERALRMIKGKTKVSGGFRSHNGGERYGNIMSIIKTAKLRHVDVFESTRQIFEGKVLFA